MPARPIAPSTTTEASKMNGCSNVSTNGNSVSKANDKVVVDNGTEVDGKNAVVQQLPQSRFVEHFTDPELDNLRIRSVKAVIYPQLLMEEIPLHDLGKATVLRGRRETANVLRGVDDRLVVVVGPCSIHDPKAAIEFAQRLVVEAKRLSEDLVVMMRVYFEKPRTTIGWKGLINDPHLDETYDVNSGLKMARRLLVEINDLGLPCASEFLDTLIPQYLCDLVSWAAIGARTTESQLHRELASGLSMPVGFKNGTTGDLQVAVDAVKSARHQHCFLSITKQGLPAIVLSVGNEDCHIVLRGGQSGPNYSSTDVKRTVTLLKKSDLSPGVMIDCSHGNSQKNHENQMLVCRDICTQMSTPDGVRESGQFIRGVMVEANLMDGKQSLPPPPPKIEIATSPVQRQVSRERVRSRLRYGVSVTDACVGWNDTVLILEELARAVKQRRKVAVSL